MPSESLKKTQQQFLNSILNKSARTSFVKSPLAEERMAIYRNTIMENMRNSLAITYPGIWKLIGEDCGRAATNIFCSKKSNLPEEGCIDFWGEKFPDFLASREEFNNLPYIKDYGIYEWLKHLAYIRNLEESQFINELEKYNEEESNHLALEFQKSAFLFSSKYPINKIETMLSNPDSSGFNIYEAESYSIITKAQTFWIDKAYFGFIESLQKFNISESYQISLKIDKEFDLSKAVNFLFENQLVTKTYIMEKEYA